MPLHRVTITGADDGTDTADLLALSREFPFLELGILFSATKAGVPRYPSVGWAFRLAELVGEGSPLKLSAHVCGEAARKVLRGCWDYRLTRPEAFGRVQLNIAGRFAAESLDGIVFTIRAVGSDAEEVIIQTDPAKGDSLEIIEGCIAEDVTVSCLIDASGGRGHRPSEWHPETDLPGVPIGYAGGLSPDNLAAELPRIAKAAGVVDYWIDLESGARTGDRFDLAKARRVLEIAAPFVTA